jgi:hypothetical protein
MELSGSFRIWNAQNKRHEGTRQLSQDGAVEAGVSASFKTHRAEKNLKGGISYVSKT